MSNNSSDLKKFAQAARRSLRQQVAARLEQVLRTDSAELREKSAAIRELQDQIAQTSKQAVIDRVAYTWFNRFCALRYMDVNRYTRIGVVSPAERYTQPEILQEAKQGYIDEDLKRFIDAKMVFELLNGQRPSSDPQGEAYRLLLVATCNSYNGIMPFMFEKIADYTELLMPLDLLSEHSVLHDLRRELTSEACQDVEVIGWLYQYYISERKNEVFEALKQNQKIEAQDIPAATQLFTPHWIVCYLVENSLGRLWLLNRPSSRLAEKMEYYIKPVQEETDFLRVSSPEELKICDPACGSGHMLTYAFDLLYAIYEEEGYQTTDIPRLILEKNLYGIEIDPRAGALAAFALFIKARGKDKRFFSRPVQPNICVLENVTFTEQELGEYTAALGRDLFTEPLLATLKQFEQADNFGSLIRPVLADAAFVRQTLEARNLGGNIFLYGVRQRVLKVLEYAEYLAPRYHVVVANPPYMGDKNMNEDLKEYLGAYYNEVKTDTFAAFIRRNSELTLKKGLLGFMTPFVWMFISSYEKLRKYILETKTIISLVQLEYSGFEGATVPICTFTIENVNKPYFRGGYIRLSDFRGSDVQAPKTIEAINHQKCGWFYRASAHDFKKIPGTPIAYWTTENFRNIFVNSRPFSDMAYSIQGMITGNNEIFLRLWFEVDRSKLALYYKDMNLIPVNLIYWIPYNKGGELRKWYGNNDWVLNWKNEGRDLTRSRTQNKQFYLQPCITWTFVSSAFFAARICPAGFVWDVAGSSAFPIDPQDSFLLLGLMCSSVTKSIFKALNPTLNYQVENILSIPVHHNLYAFKDEVSNRVDTLAQLTQLDWDSYERSWDFKELPLLTQRSKSEILFNIYNEVRKLWKTKTYTIKKLEEENNQILIEAYGLRNELSSSIPLEEITLTCNPHYRYGGKKSEEELEILLKADTMKEFISYAVGCMFGRYSLDKPGLVLANQGETIEDFRSKIEGCRINWEEVRFKPDEDNCISVLDSEWFSDDITERFKKFVRVTFGEGHYEENLAFIEDAIGRDIRSYFVKEFYKEHVQMYKKRPIYWMFSSPKGSFNVLIYMHRYQPDTISVILNRYLREFRAKLEARKSYLEQISISPSATPREKTAALKEIEKLNKVLEELLVYEREVLFPLAAQRIAIDLDDGVKVNYAKFGEALQKIPGL